MALASINGAGWSAEYSGTPPTFAPDSAPETISVSRGGFDATGGATSYADTLILTKRVRQAYPNQASLSATTVSLSDYVYSTDTIIGVTNNSTETSPKPIAQWLMRDRRIVGNSIAGELVAVHRDARGKRPVACVIVTASDGTTTVSQTVSLMTVSTSTGDACPVLVYAFNLDISSLANSSQITVNAKVYPWLGGSGSVLDSATGTADNAGFVPQMFRKDTTRASTPYYAYVATGGSDSTGVASTNAAAASASPCATIGGAHVKLRAAIGSAYIDGSIIRLKDGAYVLGAGNVFNTYQTYAETIIERDPASTSRAAVILQFGAANLGYDGIKYYTIRDLTLNRMGNFSLYADTALAGRIAIQDVTLDCANNGLKLSNSRLMLLGGITLLNAEGTSCFQTSSGQALSLFRGVTGGGTSAAFSVEGFAIFGCALTNAACGFISPRISGAMTMFNRFLKVTGEFWSPGGGAVTGVAFVQNLVEWTSATASVALGPSRDSDTGTVSHLCVWQNSFLGANNAGRSNILYDDGPNGNLRTHKLQSFVGNIHVQINTKNDWFAGVIPNLADASSHVGNWSYVHGVGCRGEVSLYQDAGPGQPYFRQDYPGLKASIGTSSTTPNAVGFTTNGAATFNGASYTAGAGGSNARLTGSTNVAYGRIPVGTGVLPFDLLGTARRSDAAAAAGAYENEQPVPVTGSASLAMGRVLLAAAATAAPPAVSGIASLSLAGVLLSALASTGMAPVSGSASIALDRIGLAALANVASPVSGSAALLLDRVVLTALGGAAAPAIVGGASLSLAALRLAGEGALGEAVLLPLDLIKQYLRIDRDDEDDLIEAIRSAAIEWVERTTGHLLSDRSIVEAFDGFARIALDAWPVTSVDSIEYRDAEGVVTLLDPASYRASLMIRPATIKPVIGSAWPLTERVDDAVMVSVTAGYATPALVPHELRQAALLVIAGLYENRATGGLDGGTEKAALALCSAFRRWII
jgi:uncharacterized phiE125 gp8 family phage protein